MSQAKSKDEEAMSSVSYSGDEEDDWASTSASNFSEDDDLDDEGQDYSVLPTARARANRVNKTESTSPLAPSAASSPSTSSSRDTRYEDLYNQMYDNTPEEGTEDNKGGEEEDITVKQWHLPTRRSLRNNPAPKYQSTAITNCPVSENGPETRQRVQVFRGETLKKAFRATRMEEARRCAAVRRVNTVAIKSAAEVKSMVAVKANTAVKPSSRVKGVRSIYTMGPIQKGRLVKSCSSTQTIMSSMSSGRNAGHVEVTANRRIKKRKYVTKRTSGSHVVSGVAAGAAKKQERGFFYRMWMWLEDSLFGDFY